MIYIKTNEEIEKMRQSGRIVAEVHQLMRELVRPGVTTAELDAAGEALIRSRGATPSFLGYRGYPASLCISVNEEVVHGIPGSRIIQEGDIVSIDVGAYLDGYHGDGAITLPVGNVDTEWVRLMAVTEEALYRGIEAAQVGNQITHISQAVQNHVEAQGFSVVRDLIGHGIGKSMHEDPEVPNFVTRRKGAKLQPGMVIAIEPMVNMGTHLVTYLSDGWTVVTGDRKPSAHFEHTVAIMTDGPKILTAL